MTSPKKRTVLLVDDNAVYRKMVADIVEEAGAHFIEAADAPEGLDKIQKNINIIDVLLIDVVLPSLNGFQVLEEVRKHPRGAGIPTLILTGATPDSAMENDLARLQAAHLDKAETVESLKDVLGNLFQRLQSSGR